MVTKEFFPKASLPKIELVECQLVDLQSSYVGCTMLAGQIEPQIYRLHRQLNTGMMPPKSNNKMLKY